VRTIGFGNEAAFSPDGQILATAAEEHTVKVWDAKTGDRLETLRGHTGDVHAVAFSPDSRRLVSGSRDHSVKVWDMTRWDKAQNR
jgi:WD40 repeat protein